MQFHEKFTNIIQICSCKSANQTMFFATKIVRNDAHYFYAAK
jgi:hypothetical protein